MPRKIIYPLLFVFLVLFMDTAYALNLDKIKGYFLAGDYKGAILEGEKILSSYRHSQDLDELYYILGLSYLKDDNFLRASDIFEIILKEYKNSRFREEAKLGLGDTYFLRGDFIRAESFYKELLNSNPDTRLKAVIFYRLSQIKAKSGDAQAAKEYSAKLKANFPLHPEATLNQDLYFSAGSSADFYYTVQVGSFSHKTNAYSLMQRLTQKGYPAYVEEVSFQGAAVYRVRVGRLQKRQEAQDWENKLTLEGYPTKIFP